MMKLFKKKKSDKNIANTISHQQQQSRAAFDSPTSTVSKKPVPYNKSVAMTIPVANTTIEKPQVARYSPPSIVMPKPRRMVTPTRAILGRFDHDKTQVENEDSQETNMIPRQNDLIDQQEISPILLPTPREVEPLMSQIIIKPVARHGVINQEQQQKSIIQPAQAVLAASSHSTVMSDDSSRVYESAVESLPESSIENDQVADLPDIPSLSKQQLQQQQESGILSDHSSCNVSPHQKQQQQSRPIVPTAGPSSTSSATITPLLHHPQSIKEQTIDVSSSPPVPALVSSPVPAPTFSDSTVTMTQQQQQQQEQQYQQQLQQQQQLQLQQQKQREEQELLLQLKKQVELMEQQRIKDREEWSRKEQELLDYRQQMMETLMETKEQLTNALKSKEENNDNRAKEAFYQKQLQQQQLHQLQKQVSEMGLHHPQEHQHMNDDNERAHLFQGQQQQCIYNYDNEAPHNGTEAVSSEEDVSLIQPQQRRVVNKCRSDDQLKYNINKRRSSSRSSHHYNQAMADEAPTRASSSSTTHQIDHDGRRSNTAGNYDEVMLMQQQQQQQQRRIPLARRGSATSNKSGHRSEHQSPAVAPAVIPASIRRKGPRPRARSNESARYYQEQMMTANNHNRMINVQEIDGRMMHPPPPNQYRYPRRSRSVGRDGRRPPSRASSAYNVHFDGEFDQEDDEDDEEYMDPNMYDSGYYTHPDYMENVPPPPPPHHQKPHMMLRYNPQDIPPRYGHPNRPRPPPPPPPPQMQLQQQQPQYGTLYSPAIDYYQQQQQQQFFQQQQPMRHTPRYNAGARHPHYNYN